MVVAVVFWVVSERQWLSLSLASNHIGDTGLSALSTALAANVSLTALDLTDIDARGAGLVALATALATNSTLQVTVCGRVFCVSFLSRTVMRIRYSFT